MKRSRDADQPEIELPIEFLLLEKSDHVLVKVINNALGINAVDRKIANDAQRVILQFADYGLPDDFVARFIQVTAKGYCPDIGLRFLQKIFPHLWEARHIEFIVELLKQKNELKDRGGKTKIRRK